MKTFSKFLEEAYNFRLGGSSKKGFEQTKYKTFADLALDEFFYEVCNNYQDQFVFDGIYAVLKTHESWTDPDDGWEKIFKEEHVMDETSYLDDNETHYFTTDFDDAKMIFEEWTSKQPEKVYIEKEYFINDYEEYSIKDFENKFLQ